MTSVPNRDLGICTSLSANPNVLYRNLSQTLLIINHEKNALVQILSKKWRYKIYVQDIFNKQIIKKIIKRLEVDLTFNSCCFGGMKTVDYFQIYFRSSGCCFCFPNLGRNQISLTLHQVPHTFKLVLENDYSTITYVAFISYLCLVM